MFELRRFGRNKEREMTSHYREPLKKKEEPQVMAEQPVVIEKLGAGTYYPLCKTTDRSMLLVFYSVAAICVTAIILLLVFSFVTLPILVNG